MFRRAVILTSALLLTFAFSDSIGAQGRQGKGPSFCRTGQGHPRFGWQWCEARGWDRRGGRIVQRDRSGRIIESGRVADGRRNQRAWRTDVAFDQGYTDGYDKGLEDADKNRSFDPTRHSWYRNADREYDSRYGDRNAYKNEYRQGFRDGYDEGFRESNRYERRDQRGSSGSGTQGSGTAIPRRWPF